MSGQKIMKQNKSKKNQEKEGQKGQTTSSLPFFFGPSWTTRVAEGLRRPSLSCRRSLARALPSLNLEKKRDCSRSAGKVNKNNNQKWQHANQLMKMFPLFLEHLKRQQAYKQLRVILFRLSKHSTQLYINAKHKNFIALGCY